MSSPLSARWIPAPFVRAGRMSGRGSADAPVPPAAEAARRYVRGVVGLEQYRAQAVDIGRAVPQSANAFHGPAHRAGAYFILGLGEHVTDRWTRLRLLATKGSQVGRYASTKYERCAVLGVPKVNRRATAFAGHDRFAPIRRALQFSMDGVWEWRMAVPIPPTNGKRLSSGATCKHIRSTTERAGLPPRRSASHRADNPASLVSSLPGQGPHTTGSPHA